MKKIIIFLITITLLSLLSIENIEAKTTSFYEAESIDNIWMNKRKPNGVIYYNKARFFRESSTNNIAYCIEPFIFFDKNNNTYESTQTPANLTESQIKEMSIIAHFGYGYKNHTEPKWYAITQFMLWKIAEPTGYYYFSTYKNGPETPMFQEEMNELTTLVNNYKKQTSFNNNTYYIVENETLTLTDTNNVLTTFKLDLDYASIKDNKLIINSLPAGTYTINMQKESTLYNKPILFYQSPTNQDIIDIGDPSPLENKITINVLKTDIKITKLDKETLTKIPQGNASLIGATFDLYTTYGDYIKTITIDENSTASITNLPLGTYYLKEKSSGEGYKLNEFNHYFTLTKDNTTINIEITNEVIKGKLLIKKEYGYKENFQPEQNISFNIYNQNSELIKTIMTNKEGLAEIVLPYGKYKLTQLTTTEGYYKIEPIYFEITSEETLYYNLKDYKIPVPNTKTQSFFHKLLNFIRTLLCGKK